VSERPIGDVVSPLLLLYVVAALAGMAAGSLMRRSRYFSHLERVVGSGGLLVTLVIGLSAAATWTRGGLLASLGWLLLGWTLGMILEGWR
jgi:hypothetical protein